MTPPEPYHAGDFIRQCTAPDGTIYPYPNSWIDGARTMKYPVITADMLHARNACGNQVDLFERTFPNGAKITVANARKYGALFDAQWAANNLLKHPAWEAYKAVDRSAREAYQAAKRPAWEAYKAVEHPAREAYEAAKRSAWEAYKAVEHPAREAYEAVRRPASEAYKAVDRSAREAYEAVRRPASEAYKAVDRSAREAYEAVEHPAWEAYKAVDRSASEAYRAECAVAFARAYTEQERRQ